MFEGSQTHRRRPCALLPSLGGSYLSNWSFFAPVSWKYEQKQKHRRRINHPFLHLRPTKHSIVLVICCCCCIAAPSNQNLPASPIFLLASSSSSKDLWRTILIAPGVWSWCCVCIIATLNLFIDVFNFPLLCNRLLD